ncbi:MAG: hypothetical protein Q9185_006866 [Variospora sp. 1 TL-2023]
MSSNPPRRTGRAIGSHSPGGHPSPVAVISNPQQFQEPQAPAGNRTGNPQQVHSPRDSAFTRSPVLLPFPSTNSPRHPGYCPVLAPPTLDTRFDNRAASSPYERPMDTNGMNPATVPANDSTLHQSGHQRHLLGGTSAIGRNPPLHHYRYVDRNDSDAANTARSDQPRLPALDHLENRTIPGLMPMEQLARTNLSTARRMYMMARMRALPGLSFSNHDEAFHTAWHEQRRLNRIADARAATHRDEQIAARIARSAATRGGNVPQGAPRRF